MPSRLSLLALFFGAPMLLLGAVTNSWWSVDEGSVNLGAGLTKIKVCRGALNCQAVSYSLFDASMKQLVDDEGSVPGITGQDRVRLGKSYAWAGSAVFWLSILGSLMVLVFYKTASTGDPWRPAALAALAVVGTATALALLFVVKKPNVVLRVASLDFGYSFFMYFIGAAAIGYGLVVEGLMTRYVVGDAAPTSWSVSRVPNPAQSASATSTSTDASRPGSTPVSDSGQACKSCGGAAVFREDVGCLVCSQCGVLI